MDCQREYHGTTNRTLAPSNVLWVSAGLRRLSPADRRSLHTRYTQECAPSVRERLVKAAHHRLNALAPVKTRRGVARVIAHNSKRTCQGGAAAASAPRSTATLPTVGRVTVSVPKRNHRRRWMKNQSNVFGQ